MEKTNLASIIRQNPEAVGAPVGYQCETGRLICTARSEWTTLVPVGTQYLTYWFEGDTQVHLLQFPNCNLPIEAVVEPD